MTAKTPLENWIGKKIGLAFSELDREKLEQYQLAKFRSNLDYAKTCSPFYRRTLAGVESDCIGNLSDIQAVPFTSPDDIKLHGGKMLCVSQGEVARIVSLDTSGTTDLPKRVYFTAEDQELTIDFFAAGMSTFTAAGDRVLILLPGVRPGSIGDLLKAGLSRIDAEGIIYGVVDDQEKVAGIILDEGINVIVGIPQQVMALAGLTGTERIREQGLLKAVLLSTDYVSDAAVRRISRAWGCTVYEHYGMTEMGLGGGVFCRALAGYHLREADMLFEIVDPASGKTVADGEFGEVVFTTLTRRGMPLIRYRTGDISRFRTQPCACGTVLKTMDKVQCRIAAAITLADGYVLTISALEEMLFAIEGVDDFDAVVSTGKDGDILGIYVSPDPQQSGLTLHILNALNHWGAEDARVAGSLQFKVGRQPAREPDKKAIIKRRIVDERIRR